MSRLTTQEVARLAVFANAPNAFRDEIPSLFFRSALLEHSIAGVSWRTFARAARETLFQMSGDTDAWERVAFARDVARRHLGEPALLSWPTGLGWYEALSASERFAALAHVVQSASDADLEVVGEYAASAEAAVGNARTPDALRLLGAVGRAHAAIGAYAEAARTLEDAVEGWFSLGLIGEASHALSELLRVRGIEGNAGAVEALVKRVRAFRDGSNDSISKAFVSLALGRAWIQCARHDLGRDELGEKSGTWHEAPVHCQASRLRWLHFSAIAREDEADAERWLSELDALEDEGRPYESDQRYLARIDRALARGTVFTSHVEGLLALTPGGEEAARSLARLAPGVPMKVAMVDRKAVRKMVWEHRY